MAGPPQSSRSRDFRRGTLRQGPIGASPSSRRSASLRPPCGWWLMMDDGVVYLRTPAEQVFDFALAILRPVSPGVSSDRYWGQSTQTPAYLRRLADPHEPNS